MGGDWDFFLTLTEDCAPVELPAVALYSRTTSDDHLSGRQPGAVAADRVRAKWAHRHRARG